MSTFVMQDLTLAQLLNIGDGLVAGGHYAVARQAYEVGVRQADNYQARNIFMTRAGLAAKPKTGTQAYVRVARELEAIDPNVFICEGMATWRKTTPFFEDERFVELAEKHAALLPIPNWHWNLQTVVWAIQQVKALDGDFVELGVFRGHTTLFAAEYFGFAEWPRRWLLFDTFEGIPEDQLDPNWAKVNKDTYVGVYSYEEVEARFAPFPNIEVIKGRVPEVLEGRAPDRIAFLHVDLNNTTAEIGALEALYDRIVPGGVIVLDDYTWAVCRAQHLAEREWFARKGLSALPLPTGQGVFVKPPA